MKSRLQARELLVSHRNFFLLAARPREYGELTPLKLLSVFGMPLARFCWLVRLERPLFTICMPIDSPSKVKFALRYQFCWNSLIQ